MNGRQVIAILVIIVLIILGVVFLRGDGRVPTVEIPEDMLESYQNENFDFSFEYPSDLEFSVSSEPERTITVEGVDYTIREMVNVSLISPSENPEAADDVYALVVNNPEIGFEGLAKPSRRDRQIGGIRAQREVLEDEGSDRDFIIYRIENDGDIYFWIANIASGDKEAEGLFDFILDSFTFSDQTMTDEMTDNEGDSEEVTEEE